MIVDSWSKCDTHPLKRIQIQRKAQPLRLGISNKPLQCCRFTNDKLDLNEAVDPVQGRPFYYAHRRQLIMNIACVSWCQM